MSDNVGSASGRSHAVQDHPAGSVLHGAPARCVHTTDGAAAMAECGCGLTWCDTPWSSSRAGCPWYNVRGA